jgi:spore coat protein U-like protein
MISALSSLNYNLYSDPAHTVIWGNGSGGSSQISGSISVSLTGASRDFTIYGQIPAGQTAKQGIYADSIVATLTY